MVVVVEICASVLLPLLACRSHVRYVMLFTCTHAMLVVPLVGFATKLANV